LNQINVLCFVSGYIENSELTCISLWGVGVISGALLYIKEDFEAVGRNTFLQVNFSPFSESQKRDIFSCCADFMFMFLFCRN